METLLDLKNVVGIIYQTNDSVRGSFCVKVWTGDDADGRPVFEINHCNVDLNIPKGKTWVDAVSKHPQLKGIGAPTIKHVNTVDAVNIIQGMTLIGVMYNKPKEAPASKATK